MSDDLNDDSSVDALRARANAMEQQLRQAITTQQEVLLRAELKVEAVRAGMIDLDGLKLVDTTGLNLGENGEIEGGRSVMQKLRRSKPWLFGQASSSNPGLPPPALAPAAKSATDMSLDEWRAARADLLRRRG
jgi:hypothetical protein